MKQATYKIVGKQGTKEVVRYSNNSKDAVRWTTIIHGKGILYGNITIYIWNETTKQYEVK